MKRGRIEKVYALILLIIFGGIVLHAPFSVYFGTVFPGADLFIKSWKEILMLSAAPLATILIQRRNLWKELVRDGAMQLILVYVLLHVMTAAALLTGPLATLAGLAIDLRYVVFFVLVYVLMKAAPAYRRQFVGVAVGGAVIVIGFAVMQQFLPRDILSHIGYGDDSIQPYLTVDKNPRFVRINSTLRGPNPLGAYVVIVLGLLAAVLARGRLRWERSREVLLVILLTIGSLVALWTSYSRSALGTALIAAGVVAAVALWRRMSRRVWTVSAIVLCAFVGLVIVMGRDSTLVANVILHDNPGTGAMVTSNDGHISSLQNGINRFLKQPMGTGVGSTGSASLMTDTPLIVENQYLFIAHEVGWLGLGLFTALLIVVFARLWHNRSDWLSLGVFASGVGLLLIGLVLPVWVDDTVSIIWWGLAAVALGAGGKHDR